jgi:uncharacterized membrane protein YoaK (UPF0700 family)
VVGIYSVAGGVGKTILCANFGRMLCSLGEQILLVDAAGGEHLPYYFGASDARDASARLCRDRLAKYSSGSSATSTAGAETRLLDDGNMPIPYLRSLTSPDRSEQGTRHIARYLAFIAGAANAGGFLAVHQYTSHMSGVVAAMADNLVLGRIRLVLIGFLAVCSFLAGSISTTLLILWARRRRLQSEYALPLLCESMLFAAFAVTTTVLHEQKVAGTIALLCFAMGLQNAMITKLSGSVIRTTHITGMVTDIGITCGRVFTFVFVDGQKEISQEVRTLRLLGSLVLLFFCGGIGGAVGFQRFGFMFMAPLSAGLLLLAFVPAIDDIRARTLARRF